MNAERHANDGIVKSIRDPKVVKIVTEIMVSQKTLTEPIPKLPANQVSEALRVITVDKSKNLAHTQCPPSSGPPTSASSDRDHQRLLTEECMRKTYSIE